MTAADPAARLRQLSAEELRRVGEDSLRNHLRAQAILAHQKHGPVTLASLDALLRDPECLRYPTRLAFEFGEMALHQFAHPEVDWRATEQGGRVLHLRPGLRGQPDRIVQAVAYMIPVVNYGDVLSDEHCLLYGATLLGMRVEEYYERICALADWVGTEPRYVGP